MPLTLRNSEEQAMFDAITIAGWEILETERSATIVSPSGVPFAVYIHAYRPLIYDVFDTFTQYNYFR